MAFWSIASLRTILDTETDADSPGSEELLSQIRENFEVIAMLLFATGAASAATADPPDDATGKLEDTVAGFTDDQHNGRTLVILSGLAKGNTYTIDDTVAADDAIYCAGDNLYSDGVRSADDYIILYDVKTNADGHDHDGVNSKSVVLADSVITQAKLKTTSGSVNTSNSSYQSLTLPGGEYGFYPQVKRASGGSTDYVTAMIAYAYGITTYTTIIAIKADGGVNTVYAQQRYVQSSGEVHWVFLLRDKTTGKTVSAWQAPDHPCFGNGGDPETMPHPFGPVAEDQEVLVITLTPDEVKAMKTAEPGADLLEIIAARYDIMEDEKTAWPDTPVTVGLPPDWDAAWLERTPVKPVKKIIPKPDGVTIALLRRKADV